MAAGPYADLLAAFSYMRPKGGSPTRPQGFFNPAPASQASTIPRTQPAPLIRMIQELPI